jgi:hypothetical protein
MMAYTEVHKPTVTNFSGGSGGEGRYTIPYCNGIHSITLHPYTYQLQQYTVPYIYKTNKMKFVGLTQVIF